MGYAGKNKQLLLKNKLQGEKEWEIRMEKDRWGREHETVFFHNISSSSSTLKSTEN